MSASADEISERRRLSNVTFSSISSDVLLVRIRKMSGEVKEEDISRTPNLKPLPKKSAESEKNIRSKFTATKTNKTSSSKTSQTFRDEPSTSAAKATSDSTPCLKHAAESTPCLKHAAENISRKASNIPSEKIRLCDDCSNSMLSYIFVVQDFLDSLAKEIIGGEPFFCVQCARQEVRNNLAAADEKDGDLPAAQSASRKRPDHKFSSSRKKDVSHDRTSGKKTPWASICQDPKRSEGYQKTVNPLSQGHANQQKQSDFIYPSTSVVQYDVQSQNLSERTERHIIIKQSSSNNETSRENEAPHQGSSSSSVEERTHTSDSITTQSVSHNDQASSVSQTEVSARTDESASQSYVSSSIQLSTVLQQTKEHSEDKTAFRRPLERQQPNYQIHIPVSRNDPRDNDPHNNNVPVKSPSVYSEGVDGIVSTLSNAEREIYDSARNGAGWECLTEPQERLGIIPPGNVITSEAFVTSCRNNAEAIGCLVVGTSLLLCRTSRTLCVLVSDGVSTAFRSALSTVFQVVQYVRSLDSLGTTKLALLEQPELGITFEKLNIWRLVQFSKCVYLNPDTLVIQNCDELFTHEELSAVPDIGWPDCFNSGVFVYSPSVHTFWQLVEFAEKQGSYDGGDQGLLNSYFNSWSSDISKKLSFIYNLMANVSYTYSPAFKQFGRDVKIVQFHGSFKPWHVKFFSKTGQISPSSLVHPTYVQFVHIWINIFRITVLRLLSETIQSYAASQETISAVETLRFFPLPSESEAEFFLTPPSVRLRLVEKKLARSSNLPPPEERRRKSAEFFRYESTEKDLPEVRNVLEVGPSPDDPAEESKSDRTESQLPTPEAKLDESTSEVDDVFKEVKAGEKEKVKDKNVLPGSEVGDYQGMKAWEQGRMDYEGTDRSDNVIKRLQFLMSSKNK